MACVVKSVSRTKGRVGVMQEDGGYEEVKVLKVFVYSNCLCGSGGRQEKWRRLRGAV